MTDYYRELMQRAMDMDRNNLMKTARRLHKISMKRIDVLHKHDFLSHAERRLISKKEELGYSLRKLPLNKMNDATIRSMIRSYSDFLSSKSSSYSSLKNDLREIMKIARKNELELTEKKVLKFMERGENLHYAIGKLGEIIGGTDWVKDFYEQAGSEWREAETRLATYYARHDIKEIKEMGLGGIEDALKAMDISF